MRIPARQPIATTHRAIRKVVPAPFSTRLKISRPRLSVPRMWAGEGALIFAAESIAVGL